ncbi:hypothetical protein SBC2_09170 [Caballeronia sp. SBC2]|nr:hypothetical protein SBC2_09170 [Caballeronia sp. SBC2]
MSGNSELRDLFDCWERVWHQGQYDLIPSGVGQEYIRHDEKGDRTVTRDAYAAEIAQTRQERPDTRFVIYDHSFEGNRHGSALHSSGQIQPPARNALGRACNSTGSRLVSSPRHG